MCGSENGLGIIMGLIAAGAILIFTFAETHHWGAHAAQPAQHTISAPGAHVALQLAPVTLDIDLAHSRVSLEVRL